MLPASPFLQLVPGRVAAALRRLHNFIWIDVEPISRIEATAAQPEHRTFAEASREDLSAVLVPTHWGQLWDQRWFRLELAAPAAAGQYLVWDDQSEATLYVDGVPHYGLDPAHRRAPLPTGCREIWIEAVVCQTAIWHPDATGLDPNGSHLRGARIVRRDETNWQLYHDFQALDDVARAELRAHFGTDAARFGGFGPHPQLLNVSPLLRRLLRALDEAVDAWETTGADAARARLAKTFADLPASAASARAVLTGHAHIDLVWLWPERVGEFKAVHTFATATHLFTSYPEFRMGYSQPASYAAVARRAPALHAQVSKRIQEGVWDAVGATYVESDTLLACGEALARSFLLGQRDFTALRGAPSRLLWLPDVFGYAPCLPQLMRSCGVDYFYTTKLSWSAINRFPYSSFIWRGHDGSEVVCHITHEGGYNQEARAEQLRLGESAHRQSDVHHEFLAPTGFGDGGGGVTEEMCERARRFANLAGVPPTTWGNLEPFFDRLAARRESLPVYQGELYLEYHRGTYTTHGDIKAGMRRAERALQIHEAVRCARGGGPLDETSWRRVVFAQFHDYIPGSSIHEVYDEAREELARIAEQVLANAKTELHAPSSEVALFNPLPRPRLHVLGANSAGAVDAVIVPPLGGQPLSALRPVSDLAPVRGDLTRLENGRVRAAFDDQGRVSSLEIDGRPLALSAPLGELVVYPDRPAMFEAWDIDRQALAIGEAVRSPAHGEVEHSDAAGIRLAFRRSLGESGEAIVRYTLTAGAAHLFMELEIDWRREDALLKMLFPTCYAARQARYGAPFGSVTRSQVPGESLDEARWEVPASRWAAVTDETEAEGLFVVTEAKYGFSCRDGVLGLSLLRSALITAEGMPEGARCSHPPAIRRTRAARRCSDIGRHTIALALGRHCADAPREEQAAALADTLFTPVIPYQGPPCSAGFLEIKNGDSLQPTWAKPADRQAGTWILRLNETLGRRGSANLRPQPGYSLVLVDMTEKQEGTPLSIEPNGMAALTFTPYAILNVLFTPRGDLAGK